jgi:hypothetical protein
MEKECTICNKSSSMGRQYKKLISRYNPGPKKKNISQFTMGYCSFGNH